MIYGFLSAHRNLVFFLAGIVILIAGLFLCRINVTNNALVLIPDSEKTLKEAARILSDSPAANILFVDIEGPDPGGIAALVEKSIPPELAVSLGSSLEAITPEEVIRAIPPMFTPELEAKFDGIDLEKAMLDDRKLLAGFGSIAAVDWIRTDPLQFRKILRDLLPANNSLFNDASSSDGRHSLLLLKPAESALDTASAIKLIDIIKSSMPAGYRLTMSGAPVHTAANALSIQKDLLRIISWSIAGFAAAYVLLARSWGAAWILATAIVSIMCAMAATGLAWKQASGIAIGFGASLMGLAEDYAVHMHFALRSGIDQRKIYGEMTWPLAQSFLLNASGFAILLFSAIPAIRQMAFFAVVSLSTGFALAILVLPFLPGFTRPRNIKDHLKSLADRPALLRSVPASCLLAILCVLLYRNLDFDFAPAALGASGREIAAATHEIRERWQIEPAVNIIATGATRDAALQKAERIAGRLRQVGAADVVSASDFIFPQAEQESNVNRWNAWIRDSELENRIISEGKRHGFGEEAFRPFFDAIRMPPASMKGPGDLLVFGTSAIIRAAGMPDGFSLDESDALVFSPEELEKTVSDKFSQTKTLIGAAAITLAILIWILIRRWRRIFAILIPPLFSVSCIFLVYVLFRLSFNLASIAALPIVFGLALDHGIMMTHSLDSREALGSRRAIALASITAFFSIGLLAISDHPALRSMGIVIFAGLLGEFVAALWFIPLLYPKIRSNP